MAKETRKDAHLGEIVQLLVGGKNLASYGYKAPETNYSLSSNCLIFEHRVVVPPSLRQAILNDLHTAHVGIVRMKGMARSLIYWPGIDTDIERMAKSCAECARHAHAPPKFCEHHWEYPKGPWERIHVDYAGPVAGMMLLIIVDAYSKWMEVKTTGSTTSTATIDILDELFAAYGVPVTVVSDNGRQFVSEEFETFLKRSGVKYHKTTAPYHPATNGQAERYVETTKDALRKMGTTRGSLQTNLNEFLRQYRKAPHSTTGQPPAQLFIGRNIRTRLDLVKPESTQTKVSQRQQAEFSPTYRTFKPLQTVYFLSGNPRMDKWVPGIIITRLGDIHYDIEYRGKSFKRHIDQIIPFEDYKGQEQTIIPTAEEPERRRPAHFYGGPHEPPTNAAQQQHANPTATAAHPSVQPLAQTPPSAAPQGQQSPSAPLRRSTRNQRPSQCYSPT